MAKTIKSLRLKPGIWMAPFLVHPKSRIAHEHSDWLLRKNGQLVEGLNLTPWDRFFGHKKWLLDTQNPNVLIYLQKTLKYLVEDCGFELIKLDFLYANHFNPNLSTKTADTFLRSYLAKIQKQYPHLYTLACGCPLVPAAGVVDSMRIGPDTTISPFLKFFTPKFFSRWILDSHVLPTILKRLWTKKLWNIDPDAFICRKKMGYTTKQLQKFQAIIRKGKGNIFLGDDLTKLPKWKIKKFLYPLFR